MTDDLLERATSALREETGEPELRSGLTRARMLDAAAKQRGKRAMPVRWLLSFTLALGASTALAHVTHQYFPAVWNAVMPEALERSMPEAEDRRQARAYEKKQVAKVASAPVIEAPVAAVAAAAPAVAPEAVAPAAEAMTQRAKRPHAHAPERAPAKASMPAHALEPAQPVMTVTPTAATASAAAPSESAELALFRRAMKLHDAESRAAVAAWDDFLRVVPKSPLVPEARYNRALGLVRAGRSREAKAALAPFARGDFGSFRKREAAKLIEALEARDGGVAP